MISVKGLCKAWLDARAACRPDSEKLYRRWLIAHAMSTLSFYDTTTTLRYNRRNWMHREIVALIDSCAALRSPT